MAADDDESYGLADVATLLGNENVLLLAASPGDETCVCGGFIAESCARGRPPYVAILTDGAAAGVAGQAQIAVDRAIAVRVALAALGLPEDRLLFIGFFDGTAPCEGPILKAVVAGIALVSWREDCNAICVPAPAVPGRDLASALAIARLVAADQRLRVFRALADPAAAASQDGARMKLDVSAHRRRLEQATACLGIVPSAAHGRYEFFAQDRDFRPNRD